MTSKGNAAAAILLAGLMTSSTSFADTDTRKPPPARVDGADTLEARLLKSVSHRFRHGMPYDLAMSFGPQAVPTLSRWLVDSSFKPRYPGILTLLGYLGGPKESKLIQDFVLHRYDSEIDQTELDGLVAAILALGCLSDRDSTALAFLEAASDTGFYSQTTYTNSPRGRARLHLLLSKLAINAIGLSARPEAETILRRLEIRPSHVAQLPNISDALKAHAEIARSGRRAYSETVTSGLKAR